MSYRAGSVTSAGDSLGTTLVLPRAVGAALDDILDVYFYVEDTTLTISFSSGTWTKVTAGSGEQLSHATDWEIHRYWSRQGAESGDVTISWGGANVWRSAVMLAFTGRETAGDPQDATATFNAPAGTSATVTATGLTTGNANADLAMGASNAVGATYSSPSAPLTERADFGGQWVAEGTQVAAGASGDKTVTQTVNTNFSASLVAFKEASVGAAVPVGRRDQMFHPGTGIYRHARHYQTPRDQTIVVASGVSPMLTHMLHNHGG